MFTTDIILYYVFTMCTIKKVESLFQYCVTIHVCHIVSHPEIMNGKRKHRLLFICVPYELMMHKNVQNVY